MKLWSRAGVAATAAVVAAALLLTGCSSSQQGTKGGSGTTTPSGNADAANIVKQAADVMSKVTGVHLDVTVQGQVPNLALSKLDGDVSNTPQTAATGTATLFVGTQGVDSKFVFVDGHLYSDVADPGKKYTDYGDGSSIYNVSTILDPKKGLANLLANLKGPEMAGTEQVNGVPTTKITGTSSSNDVMILAGRRLAPEKETTMPTTVWIASDGSNHLVRAQIAPVSDGTVTITLSEWGKQVTATKPA